MSSSTCMTGLLSSRKKNWQYEPHLLEYRNPEKPYYSEQLDSQRSVLKGVLMSYIKFSELTSTTIFTKAADDFFNSYMSPAFGSLSKNEVGFPPCQNSCRLVMIFNFGAIRNKYGTLRRDIEEQSSCKVVTA